MNKLSKMVFVLFIIRISISLIYFLSDNAGFGIIVIGDDEITWQEASVFISDNLFSETLFVELLAMESSWNNLGWPLLMGLVFNLFGKSYFLVFVVKSILLYRAVVSLVGICRFLGYNENLTLFNITFLLFYYPIAIFHHSFLRDDVIVYLIIICSFLIIKINYKFKFIDLFILVPFIFILFMSRFFSVLIVAYLFHFIVRNKKKYFYIALPFLIIFLMNSRLYEYIYGFVTNSSIIYNNILTNLFKFYIGPLPWNMFWYQSEYEPWWYILSFVSVFFAFFIKKFWRLLYIHRVFFLISILFIFLPYHIRSSDHDSLGPRQFAMLAPFYFLLIYSRIFRNISN